MTREILKQLAEPFPYKWRLQSAKYGKATIVAYIDSRQVQDRLDEVVGPENWQNEFRTVDGKLFGGIGIRVQIGDGHEWIWKWDTGVESNMDAEKGQVSDSFKRAAVHWQIGRFLYSLGIVTLPTQTYNGREQPTTTDGKILWGKDELTEYVNELVARGIYDATKSKAATKKEQPKDSVLPWITEAQVTTAIQKIQSGEEDILKKVQENYRVSKANLKKLQDAETALQGDPTPTKDDSTPNPKSDIVDDNGDLKPSKEFDSGLSKAQEQAIEFFSKYEKNKADWVVVQAFAKTKGGAKKIVKDSKDLIETVLDIDKLREVRSAVLEKLK